jgi:transposase InsO family protein
MCTDRGTEFINDPLKQWCRERGIENQVTAPYSPAQNSIAEWANRTLVELARAMINGQSLPEFLWEYAVAHAAYVRNCSYMRTLQGGMLISDLSALSDSMDIQTEITDSYLLSE